MQFTETDSRSRQSLESTLARDTDSLESCLERRHVETNVETTLACVWPQTGRRG